MESTRTNRSYSTIQLKNVMNTMQDTLKNTCDIICSPMVRVRSLLEANKWDHQRTVNEHDYLPAVPDSAEDVSECPICCSDIGEKFTVDECNHQCCHTCAKEYIRTQVEERCKTITCFHARCPGLIDDDVVIKMLTDLKSKEYYKDVCTSSFILSSRELVYCPGRTEGTCSGIVHLSNPPMTLGVHCELCSTCFCTKCDNGYHEPVTCQLFNEWLSRDKGFVLDKLYVREYCKWCPNCRQYIEKNEGCNHMTCIVCKHEFCWLCFGDWKKHGDPDRGCQQNVQTSTRPKNLEDAEAVIDVKRYKGYHDMYVTQQEKENQEKIHIDQIRRDLKQLLPDDTDFCNRINKEALPTLAQGRRISMFSHVFGYFLKQGSPHVSKFEGFHECLEGATNALSLYLNDTLRDTMEQQNKIKTKDRIAYDKKKQELIEVIEKSIKYCQCQIRELTEYIYGLYDLGQWRFEEKFVNPIKD